MPIPLPSSGGEMLPGGAFPSRAPPPLLPPRHPCGTEGSARGAPRLLLTPAAPDSSRPLKFGCCAPGAWSCCPTRGDGGIKTLPLRQEPRRIQPHRNPGRGNRAPAAPGEAALGGAGMPQPQPQPRTALPPLPAAAPRIARRLPASAATRGGAEPRGAEPGGDHLPGTVQGGTRWRGRRGSPLSSHLLLRRPAPARGGTGEAPAAPSPPQRSAPRWAPLRSAALGSAQPFPVRLRRRTQAHRLRPAPRGAAPWGRGGDSPARCCPGMLEDARCYPVLLTVPVLPGATRCHPVLLGCCPVMLEGARCCPPCCAPPALAAPRCHRSFPRLWVLQPPPRRAPGRAVPGFAPLIAAGTVKGAQSRRARCPASAPGAGS